MKDDLLINDTITIPEHELKITTSRAGGPGGQHVNKTNTRVTVHWNVKETRALSEQEKERVLHKLYARLTDTGNLVIHNNSSRSQHHNKIAALAILAQEIRKALYVPKKRVATRISQRIKKMRMQEKIRRGTIKKMRSVKNDQE